MKKDYEKPTAIITYFETEDVISASQPEFGLGDGEDVWE